jgi:uncharacterized protein
MKLALSAFVCGLIFAAGIAISGMTNPLNIIGFLDMTGTWRPSLVFVMVGAIFVYSISYFLIRKRSAPVLDKQFHVPTNKHIDNKLITGSMLFGVGWGVSGYCPGPAWTAIGAGAHDAYIFLVFLFAGMWLYKIFENYKTNNVKHNKETIT